MSMEEILARVQVLEDIEAIKKLKATYCYLCDAGLGDRRDPRRTGLALHRATRRWTSASARPRLRRERGPEDLLRSSRSGGGLVLHAHGAQPDHRGPRRPRHGEMVLRGADDRRGHGQPAQWMAGTYEEEYVRENGEWKFASMKDQVEIHLPLRRGLGQEPRRAAGAAGEPVVRTATLPRSGSLAF